MNSAIKTLILTVGLSLITANALCSDKAAYLAELKQQDEIARELCKYLRTLANQEGAKSTEQVVAFINGMSDKPYNAAIERSIKLVKNRRSESKD